MPSSLPRKAPTIYDVAELAGVSKSLVSLVLQGDPRVSDLRREAILRAIEELQYRPSRTAQLLASKSSKTVGVLITEYKNLAYVSVVTGIRQILDPVGITLTVSDLHRGPDFVQDPVDAFLSMNVDGIVFICEPQGLRVEDLNVPVVVVGNRATQVANADWISNDDEMGGTQILEHLFQLGHTKIAHVTGRGGIAAVREATYRKLMAAKGLPAMVFGAEGPTNEVGGFEATRELLKSKAEFTAIWVANDYMAAGAWSALLEEGLRVPADISIAGYDNSPIASDYLMKITTIDEQGIEVGRRVGTCLLARFNEGSAGSAQRILVEPTLVIRQSTAAPRVEFV